MSDTKVLYKVEYLGKKIWCKCPTGELTFENLIATAKKKFNIPVENREVTLYDKDGVLIDEDFFEDFFTMNNEEKTLVIRTTETTIECEKFNSDTTDTLTNSSANSYSFLIPNDDITNNVIITDVTYDETQHFVGSTFNVTSETRSENNEEPSTSQEPSAVLMPPPTLNRTGNIKAEELKTQIIAKQGSTNIFEEYGRLNCLTNKSRRCLVNVICDLMVERYGHYIPTRIKEEYAKCIIDIFPTLRDPFSSKGYETFFNPQKHDGFLAWRLKTLSRKNIEKNSEKRKLEEKVEKCVKKSKVDLKEVDDKNLTAEIEDIIEELKKANPKTDSQIIFTKMAESFSNRRKLYMENVLINFPRFIDTPGLIEQDFSLLHPNKPTLSECFEQYCGKILEIYSRTATQVNTELTDCEESDTQKKISCLILMSHEH